MKVFANIIIAFLIISSYSFAGSKSVKLNKITSQKYLAMALVEAAADVSILSEPTINGEKPEEGHVADYSSLEILTRLNLKVTLASKMGIAKTADSEIGVECTQTSSKVICYWVEYNQDTEGGASLDSGTVELKLQRSQDNELKVIPTSFDRGMAG